MNKLKKIKKLADAMYYAAKYLTTDASRLHKAMDEYHQFIIQEYKEENVSEDLEEVANKYGKDTFVNECMENGVCDYNDLADAFKTGAKWHKQQMMSKTIDGEVGYWNQRGLSVLMSLPSEFEENDKCKIILIKED